jgi:Ca2+-binding EF-hand superfamily protein
MSEYNRLKSMLLNIQPQGLGGDGQQSQQRDMEHKRALVDNMFKYLDVDQDGRLSSDELEKVGFMGPDGSDTECLIRSGVRPCLIRSGGGV